MMDEDEFDFVPGSSQLSSLFGGSKSADKGNASFVYSAPKQPRKEPSKPNKSGGTPEMALMFAKACLSYKLENGVYASQGKLGVAVLGNSTLHIYQLIIYKTNKEHLSKTRITKNFTASVFHKTLAVSFYDDVTQNWSVMLESEEDHAAFLLQIAIARYNSSNEAPAIIKQNIVPVGSKGAEANTTIQVTYECFLLNGHTPVPHCPSAQHTQLLLKKDETLWESQLIGASKEDRMILIIPNERQIPCSTNVSQGNAAILKLKITNIEEIKEDEAKVEQPKILAVESPESAVDSNDDSIKARGVSIKEALLGTKSHKANLISRMARMGQATLPVKPNLTASDSEEDSPVSVSPKPRIPRSKPTSHPPMPLVTKHQEQSLLVYQSEPMYSQVVRTMPMTSPMVSPVSETTMSVYISECRTQNTEIRMGLSKVTDKVDLVLSKLDKLNVNDVHKPASSPSVDPMGLLTSIQNLVTENQQLKDKAEEQRTKIESQNERIYNLLELNHKFLEENSHSKAQQNQTDVNRDNETVALKNEKLKLEAEISKMSEYCSQLKEQLEEDSNTKLKLETEIKENILNLKKLEEQRKESEDLVEKQNIKIIDLEDQIKILNMRELESRELEILKLQNVELSERWERDKTELENVKAKYNSEIQNKDTEKIEIEKKLKLSKEECLGLTQKIKTMSENLERAKELSKDKNQLSKSSDVIEEVKKVMNVVYRNLQAQFAIGENFSDSDIKKIMASTIRDVTLDYINRKNSVKTESRHFNTSAVESQMTDNIDESALERTKETKLDGNSEPNEPPVIQRPTQLTLSQESEPDDTVKEIKSSEPVSPYQQIWSSTKPPPLPLLDDEDEDDDWLS